MKLTDEWFSVLSADEHGQSVFVNGRLRLDEFRLSKKFKIRIELRLPYEADCTGMPTVSAMKLIEQIEQPLRKIMEADKLAILTGNHIGGGKKYWVFYTRTERVFQERLNEALAPFDLLPLEIECGMDADWEEYTDMMELYSAEEDESETD
ncbi:hypothetical protein HQ45_01385 [Porphyromonas crevioricanis]|uniref:DUF695 domain-containing protein n=2 Tax=Porphyromonas crevioricanis TaxID=393921 RepID=A0AB34PH40_9PORP|nr:DUF695 domain-containing protein [Porphyromonas crevioricanis]KGN90802.1 hypothetical protein HQ45_01385 [Porphyromonas crevioricanis]KGN93954.1 hypothetical protein HQ38_07010 [Porphyromonas crevioricanis]GAD05383.1 hypothetical protein PORCRE_1083 [Porphyromonas crevioricanis JCM 15906]SJZ63783.1 Family of unknown function [Porphyromonas crevioricanis]